MLNRKQQIAQVILIINALRYTQSTQYIYVRDFKPFIPPSVTLSLGSLLKSAYNQGLIIKKQPRRLCAYKVTLKGLNHIIANT